VVALAGDRATLEEHNSGRARSVRIAYLFSAPGTRLLDPPSSQPVEAVGPLLANLTERELGIVCERAAHVREVLTGYRSGSPDDALAGEPRAGYEPGSRLMDRYRAKADELGVGVRTLRRWARSFQLEEEAGLIDRRRERASDPLRGIDPRWLEVLRGVLDEHVAASRPTQALLLDRVDARAAEQHGHEVIPKRWKAKLAASELTRGTNALAGSTKAKRSIANRPSAPYGRLVTTRPGEYLLLDTTPLDVFAMDPVTLRWIGLELTIAVDLYSRSVVALRLSPVSTKAVDASLVLFEAICPDSKARARAAGCCRMPAAPAPC
jgi:DNA-binding transcriptional ArsR family regulator